MDQLPLAVEGWHYDRDLAEEMVHFIGGSLTGEPPSAVFRVCKQHPILYIGPMTTEQASPLGIADSFLPNFDRDQDKKRLYLSYRLCGFGRDEAPSPCSRTLRPDGSGLSACTELAEVVATSAPAHGVR